MMWLRENESTLYWQKLEYLENSGGTWGRSGNGCIGGQFEINPGLKQGDEL